MKRWNRIIVKEIESKTDESNLHIRRIGHMKEMSYTLSGKIKLDELKKLVEYMKF